LLDSLLQEIMDSSDSDFSEDESFITETPITKTEPQKPKVTGKKHLNDIKNMLGLDSYQAKLEKKRLKRRAAKARKKGGNNSGTMANGLIQTNASRTLGLSSVPEMVTFIDHKKRNKRAENKIGDIVPEKSNNNKEITLKDARFEVFKLGVSGMDKKSREEANTALAIKLGAKPSKNKFVEYKQLKEDRTQEKEEKRLQEEERLHSMEGVKKSSNKNNSTLKKSTNKKKKKGSKNDFKVGSFDGGMLKISQRDINSIKSKK